MMCPTVEICPDAYSACARLMVAQIQRAQQAQRPFTLALAGGQTPIELYRLLASAPWRNKIPWAHLHIFWGDERFVRLDHPQSNYFAAWQAWLAHVPIPDDHLYPMPTAMEDMAMAARCYETTIQTMLGKSAHFDLILLGLGEDGHTASLFPESPALSESQCLVTGTCHPQTGLPRLTFTLPLINRARLVVFLVCGAHKAQIVQRVLHPSAGSSPLPAQLVIPSPGKVVWLLDPPAASALTIAPPRFLQ